MAAELPKAESWHANAIKRGLCRSCGKKRDRHTRYCSRCIKRIAASNRARRNALLLRGLCSENCKRKSLPGKTRCAPCTRRRSAVGRAAYRERAQRGQCVACKRAATVGLFCFTHWLKNIGTSHGLGGKHGIAILSGLWERQDGRCAVTDEVLVPGFNASLDHIIPKSKGGSNDVSNLQWVLLQVNQVKWNMSNVEFIAICRKVIAVQDRKLRAEVPAKVVLERSN